MAMFVVAAFPLRIAAQAQQAPPAAQQPPGPAQQTPTPPGNSTSTKPRPAGQPIGESKIALDTSEALFSTLTAINMCGFDYELGSSDAVRSQVRNDVGQAIANSPDAAAARSELCRFYKDKQQPGCRP